ncbi:MAG: hypothetical protein L0Z50_27965 [Verrucomicrobiales bacterium]|nr:hypothetical protein [Verrucomicrobiales bacterium]
MLSGSRQGFTFSVVEQYIPFRDLQADGEDVTIDNPDYVDSSLTHFVLGYDFGRFSLSLNTPFIYRAFRRLAPFSGEEVGTESGLGDIALVGRWVVLQKSSMESSLFMSLLGGVKLPTGDAERLEQEVDEARLLDSFYPPGSAHDPLHSLGGVHPHDLALGSGSVDGIFGMTLNLRWKRCFISSQFQYYLRTEGESSFEFGDDLMVSGGPGAYVLLSEKYTLSLQANAGYETHARDKLLGRKSDQTGMRAWYLGPQLTFSFGRHFSAQAGVDVPLVIENNGLQSLPDYRIHGGFSFRF